MSFDGLAGYFWGYTLTGDGEAEWVLGQMVTHDYFSTLGVTPFVGLTLTPDE